MIKRMMSMMLVMLIIVTITTSCATFKAVAKGVNEAAHEWCMRVGTGQKYALNVRDYCSVQKNLHPFIEALLSMKKAGKAFKKGR